MKEGQTTYLCALSTNKVIDQYNFKLKSFTAFTWTVVALDNPEHDFIRTISSVIQKYAY